MSNRAAETGSNKVFVLSAIAVAVAVIGTGLYLNSRPGPEPAAIVETSAPAPKAEATPDPELPEETAAATPGQEPQAETTAETTTEAEAAIETETATETAAETETAAATADAEVVDTPPSIDEVRVEADGLTVVAGRASPGSNVSVLLDGVENTSVTTDAGGGFAAITLIAPKSTAQVLTIVQRMGDKVVPSMDQIILAPSSASAVVATTSPESGAQTETAAGTLVALASPDVENVAEPDVVQVAPSAPAQGDAVADAAPVSGPEADAKADDLIVAAETAQAIGDDAATSAVAEIAEAAETPLNTESLEAGDAAQAAHASAEMQSVPATTDPSVGNAPENKVAEASTPTQNVTILKSTPEGVEVLAPELASKDTVALDTISYSDEGDVQLAGRAQSDADVVRVYVNNRPVTELAVDPQGRWRGKLAGLDAGVYTLRVDEVDATGDVISRVETPFKREDPEILAQAETSATPANKITVQAGATLWAIARDRYGEGLLYVQVFEANREAIRDPDLIYPGQVFELPD